MTQSIQPPGSLATGSSKVTDTGDVLTESRGMVEDWYWYSDDISMITLVKHKTGFQTVLVLGIPLVPTWRCPTSSVRHALAKNCARV